MNQRNLAFLAATATSIIYGINHTIAKDLMPYVIEPYGFIFLRISGAAVLFWILSLWFPNEKIQKNENNNYIKRLEYSTTDLEGNSYNITSKSGQLDLDNPDIITMLDVNATFYLQCWRLMFFISFSSDVFSYFLSKASAERELNLCQFTSAISPSGLI